MDATELSGGVNHKVCDASEVVRRGFIRKVYGLLAVQLILTTVIAAPFMYMGVYQLQGMFWLFYLALASSMFIMIGLSCCCAQLARQVPYNYMFLIGITICEAVIVGFVSACYTVESVLLAAGMTAVIFVGLTLFAMFSKTDFTGMGPYLFAAMLCLMLLGIVAIFIRTLQIVYAALGALLFSFYIVYDTQMIVGGTHKQHQFSIDDYVFAALSIYLDILNLFLMLLRIFGSRR
jgi:FtsH-binding integral membrane protein